jgi:hypothetical protein
VRLISSSNIKTGGLKVSNDSDGHDLDLGRRLDDLPLDQVADLRAFVRKLDMPAQGPQGGV